MVLTNLHNLLTKDLNKVEQLIASNLSSRIALIQQIGNRIVHGGGKRLRPMLLLLCTKACGYEGADQITMAAVIEFIHTATLLHDDVVDNSMLRRGQATANNVWGNEAAVLVGDFLYSRAFQLMVGVENLAILKIIADATNAIAEGEVLQLLNQYNPETSEQAYLQTIRNKTAKLFEAAAETGAVLAQSRPHIQSAWAQYGLHVGTAYQLIDDVLDYQGSNTQTGKSIGRDLAEGKPTMPLIYLCKHGNAEEKILATATITAPQAANLEAVQEAIQKSGAINYTLGFAKREAGLAKQALAELIDSEYKAAALDLADFVVARQH